MDKLEFLGYKSAKGSQGKGWLSTEGKCRCIRHKERHRKDVPTNTGGKEWGT